MLKVTVIPCFIFLLLFIWICKSYLIFGLSKASCLPPAVNLLSYFAHVTLLSHQSKDVIDGLFVHTLGAPNFSLLLKLLSLSN